MRKKLQQILETISRDLPGYQAAAVVAVDDGLTVAQYSSSEGIDSEAAAAYLASIVKSNAKAIKLLAKSQETEDILVTTNYSYYLIRDLPQHPLFIFLMISREEWIGKARMLLLEQEKLISQTLTEYFADSDT